jgi:hypothetical protein
MTTSFWLYNPNILFNQMSIIWPTVNMSFAEKLNASSRLVIGLTLLGYILTKNIKVMLSGLATLAIIILVFLIKGRPPKGKGLEGFIGNTSNRLSPATYTEPSVTNPVMNILLPEINDDPLRNPAAPAFLPPVEADINAKTKQFVANNFMDPSIDQRLFNDLGDNFSFDRSMHAWYPMPSTTIPNDQQSFAEYCYGDMISCRDETNNELACVRNMPPRWQI